MNLYHQTAPDFPQLHHKAYSWPEDAATIIVFRLCDEKAKLFSTIILYLCKLKVSFGELYKVTSGPRVIL